MDGRGNIEEKEQGELDLLREESRERSRESCEGEDWPKGRKLVELVKWEPSESRATVDKLLDAGRCRCLLFSFFSPDNMVSSDY